jgi:hypothetical protein
MMQSLLFKLLRLRIGVKMSKPISISRKTFFVIIVVLLVLVFIVGMSASLLLNQPNNANKNPTFTPTPIPTESPTNAPTQVPTSTPNPTPTETPSPTMQFYSSTSSPTPIPETIAVQSAGVNSAGTVVTIYAQQTGGPAATPINIIIKDSTGNTVTTVTVGTPIPALTSGKMAQGTLYTIPTATITALTAGQYTATLVTASGGNFISPSFTR